MMSFFWCLVLLECLFVVAVLKINVGQSLQRPKQQMTPSKSHNDGDPPPLPLLNINKDTLSLSGISAGGAMAIQLHVSHSKVFQSMAAFAGPPYYCANANVDVALTSCMKDPALISLADLIAATTFAASALSIDNPINMRGDKIWLFTGQKDSVVVSGVMAKTLKYYENYVRNSSDIMFINSYPAEHAWITTNAIAKDCGYLGEPFLNDCGFDAAYSLLSHNLPFEIKGKGTFNESNLYQFSQTIYIIDRLPSDISFNQVGYAYIPKQCLAESTQCHLHVSLHGCEQDMDTIGTAFVSDTGLNEYAETNNLVILYPQVIRSPDIPYNPKGCFDWWGYTGVDYASQPGLQQQAIMRMIEAITGPL
eukprot:m.68078 g.68078  ORF g.68078 m.68078 type:complete len:364 (+) comp8234_c0_seq1:87-1178(+)